MASPWSSEWQEKIQPISLGKKMFLGEIHTKVTPTESHDECDFSKYFETAKLSKGARECWFLHHARVMRDRTLRHALYTCM
jgi:hypothetical protein